MFLVASIERTTLLRINLERNHLYMYVWRVIWHQLEWLLSLVGGNYSYVGRKWERLKALVNIVFS